MKNKIAVIEDNAELRENIKELLELDGYEVEMAENGKVGLSLVQDFLPDLIICDIMMPVMDGFSVLHILSKNPETATIPFIFLTAKTERMNMRKGMEMGADDFITKPFDDIELLNAISSRLKKLNVLKEKLPNRRNAFEDMLVNESDLKALERLTPHYEKRIFKKKATVYFESDAPRYLYYLHKGKVKSFKTNDDGKELIINIFSEGEFFGYIDLIKEEIGETAQALEDSELILIPKREFYSVLYGSKSTLLKLVELISKHSTKQEEQLLKMAYDSVKKRIADSLLSIVDNYKEESSKGIKIARENIANLAGTSIETCIRTLAEFKEEGLISITAGKIKVLNVAGLKNYKN